jgi:hypothetical protein
MISLWDIAPCHLMEVDRCFIDVHSLHHQHRRRSTSTRPHGAISQKAVFVNNLLKSTIPTQQLRIGPMFMWLFWLGMTSWIRYWSFDMKSPNTTYLIQFRVSSHTSPSAPVRLPSAVVTSTPPNSRRGSANSASRHPVMNTCRYNNAVQYFTSFRTIFCSIDCLCQRMRTHQLLKFTGCRLDDRGSVPANISWPAKESNSSNWYRILLFGDKAAGVCNWSLNLISFLI